MEKTKENKNIDIYEDALMNICKKQRLPETFEKLINAKFNKISINNTYVVVGVSGSVEKVLRFDLRKMENFPGEELVSEVLLLTEPCNQDISLENPLYGEIYLTFHEDIQKWTGALHVFDELNGINRIVQIFNVEIF